MTEALPLADQPQLLQPNARREDLFGMPKQPITVPVSNIEQTCSSLELPPIRLGLSSQTKNEAVQNNLNSANTVVISLTQSTPNESQSEVISDEIQKSALRIQVKSKDPEVTLNLKRPHSPKVALTKIQKTYDDDYDDDDDSGDDEPQDLSQQTASHSKLDLDDTTSTSAHGLTNVKNLFEDSDDSDATDSAALRSPVTKKHRLMDGENSQFSGIPSDKDQEAAEETDPPRPPIIVVTRRTVADAIEAVTATVLSKNKKLSLSECSGAETPLSFLPNKFVYDANKPENEQSAASSSKSSVIVRAGPSVSCDFHSLTKKGFRYESDTKEFVQVSFTSPTLTDYF